MHREKELFQTSTVKKAVVSTSTELMLTHSHIILICAEGILQDEEMKKKRTTSGANAGHRVATSADWNVTELAACSSAPTSP